MKRSSFISLIIPVSISFFLFPSFILSCYSKRELSDKIIGKLNTELEKSKKEGENFAVLNGIPFTLFNYKLKTRKIFINFEDSIIERVSLSINTTQNINLELFIEAKLGKGKTEYNNEWGMSKMWQYKPQRTIYLYTPKKEFENSLIVLKTDKFIPYV